MFGDYLMFFSGPDGIKTVADVFESENIGFETIMATHPHEYHY